MLLTTSILSLVGLLSFTSAIPIAEVDNLDLPYPVAAAVFEYQVTPNSEPVSLDGDVLEKIRKIRSEYGIKGFNDAAPLPGSRLLKRNKIKPGICCKNTAQPWLYTWYGCAQSASIILAQRGRFIIPQRSCIPGGCYGEADIWVCNDNYENINPDGGYLASYVADIQAQCTDVNSDGGHFSCGQEFDTDNYNVILRRGDSRVLCANGRVNTCAAASHW